MTRSKRLQFIDTSAIISSLRGPSFRSYVTDPANGVFLVSSLVLDEVRDEYARKRAKTGKFGTFFPSEALPTPEDFMTSIREELSILQVKVVETFSVAAETIARELSGHQLDGPPRQGDLADLLHILTLSREVAKESCEGILITGDGAFFGDRKGTRRRTPASKMLVPLSTHHSHILQKLQAGVDPHRIMVLDPKRLSLCNGGSETQDPMT